MKLINVPATKLLSLPLEFYFASKMTVFHQKKDLEGSIFETLYQVNL